MSKELGDKLRSLRENHLLTQNDLAELLTVDRSTYAYYESGKSEPRLDSLFRIARFYRVSFEWLCDDARGTYEEKGNPDIPPRRYNNKR